MGQNAPILGTWVYDSNTDVPSSCPAAPVSVSVDNVNDDGIPLPAFYDSRIKDYDTAAPVAVYPHNVNGNVGLIIYNANSVELLLISPQELADNPDGNVLIASANGVSLYRIPGSYWQINTPQYNGKTYVMIFFELFHSGGYESFEIEG